MGFASSNNRQKALDKKMAPTPDEWTQRKEDNQSDMMGAWRTRSSNSCVCLKAPGKGARKGSLTGGEP